MHEIRDDTPGCFGHEPSKTMTLVGSKIISVYGAEAISIVVGWLLRKGALMDTSGTRTTDEIRVNWKQIDILACCIDILANVVGIAGPTKDVWDVTLGE